MFSIDLPKDLEKELEEMAKKLQLSKAYCVQQAIETYLEDQEDLLIALERLDDIDSGKVKTVSWEDAKKELFS